MELGSFTFSKFNQAKKEDDCKLPVTTPPDSELSVHCDTNVANINSRNAAQAKNGLRTCIVIVSIALVLSLLALLIAIAAMYFGIHGTELAAASTSSSSQDYQLNISTLHKKVQLSQNMLRNQAATIAALTNALTRILGRFWNRPVRSCSDVPPGSPSGDYWIQTNGTSNPVQVYCDMDRTSCSCNTTGGWMRVANLEMTDPNQKCPAEFRPITRTSAPMRMCGRPGPVGCVSTTFRTYGVEYSHVCGLVIGYQDSSPDAFAGAEGTTIDSTYVDGVSLTHGQSPRQHIWTFVGARDESGMYRQSTCPCTRSDTPYTGTIPSFVGQDYFCDTASRDSLQHQFFPNDPLWDGQGCGVTSTCCEFNNPPWFCKRLPQPTTDNIELRLCGSEAINNEDTPIERVEIYVHKMK